MRLDLAFFFRSGVVLLITLACVMLFFVVASYGQPNQLPHFFYDKIRPSKPNLSQYNRVRFLTVVNFPPFNYINNDGVLAGYNIDLIRALCDDLDIVKLCQIEALPFNQLQARMQNNDGEAILAGLTPSLANRPFLKFSHRYIAFPARFIALNDDTLQEPLYDKLNGVQIGVVAKTSHDIMARAYFPKAIIVEYSDYNALYAAVLTGKVALGFGDGLRFALWLALPEHNAKLHFVGEPYFNATLLGSGMAIAVRASDDNLIDAFNYSLQRLEKSGKLQELYLRYFPIGFY